MTAVLLNSHGISLSLLPADAFNHLLWKLNMSAMVMV